MRHKFKDGPIEVDWEIHSADDWSKTFQVQLDGVAEDVSGWTFAGVITKERNSGIIIATLEWDMTDAATGYVTYHLDHPATVLARQEAWYELEFKNPKRRTFQQGICDIGFDHSELA